MEVCFCSLLTLDQNEILKKTKTSLMTGQNHKFLYAIIEGMDDNLEVPVHVINTMEVPSYPRFKQIFFSTKCWSHTGKSLDYDLGKINIMVIKPISEYLLLKKHLNKWIKNKTDKNLFICTYNRRLSHIFAIKNIKKRYPQVKSCMILGDLIGNLSSTAINGIKTQLTWKEKFNSFLLRYLMNETLNFDSFVLVTDKMAKVLKLKKPYIVLEGIYSKNTEILMSKNLAKNETIKKIILYSGSLEKEYGILTLIQAIIELQKFNYELWLIGGGSLEKDIKIISQNEYNIIYFGYISTDETYKLQQQATILINPRTNNGDYTKYSFPSKTMEYLASGKPMIGYKLDGIPKEYYKYIQIVEDDSLESLKNKIFEIGEMTVEQRNYIGKLAREFILTQKSPQVQCKKICEMFKMISLK